MPPTHYIVHRLAGSGIGSFQLVFGSEGGSEDTVSMEPFEEKIETSPNREQSSNEREIDGISGPGDLGESRRGLQDDNKYSISHSGSTYPTELEKDTAVNSYAPSERQSLDSIKRHEAGINVADAEKEFAELQRELTERSHNSKKISRQNSRPKSVKHHTHRDVEKGGLSDSADDAEPFDLEDLLRGRKAEDEEPRADGSDLNKICAGRTGAAFD